MKWEKIRELFRQIHLWIGLITGIFLFVICLTGTILVFQEEMLKILNPSVFKIENTESNPLSFSHIKSNSEKELDKNVVGFSVYKNTSKPWELYMRKKGEKGRPETVYVNPYTNEILGNKNDLVGKDFFMFNFKLHRWLLLETEVGRPIVGYLTIGFIFVTLSGFVIWFPKKVKHWKNGLKVKWGANWKRVNHDFHTAFGFYSAGIILILALTGLCWSFSWYTQGLSYVLGTKVFDRSKKELIMDDFNPKGYKLDEVLSTVTPNFELYDVLRINLPDKKSNAIEINAYHKGFADFSLADSYYINPMNAEIIETKLIKDMPLNQIIAKSIHDLHMGYLFGTLNKIIFFSASLIGTFLCITGILIWWNKRKKKPKRKKK